MSLPQPLPSLDTQSLRAALAGIVDNHATVETVDFREQASRLWIPYLAALPRVFGDSLERKTMWSKIGAVVIAAIAKTRDGDLSQFHHYVLEGIQADLSLAVASEPLTIALSALLSQPTSHHASLLHFLRDRVSTMITFAKPVWTAIKETSK